MYYKEKQWFWIWKFIKSASPHTTIFKLHRHHWRQSHNNSWQSANNGPTEVKIKSASQIQSMFRPSLSPWMTNLLYWIRSSNLQSQDKNTHGRIQQSRCLLDLILPKPEKASDKFLICLADHFKFFLVYGNQWRDLFQSFILTNKK